MVHNIDSKEEIRSSKDYFFSQSNIILGIFGEKDLDERTTQIRALLGSSCQTAMAIIKLGEKPEFFLAEIIMLARALIEKMINFCYLLICDEAEFQRFIKHTVQKSYRKLDRKVAVGKMNVGLKFMGSIDFDANPHLKEALNDFTSHKGREITHWTKTTIEDRMQLLSERSKIDVEIFMIATLLIYEDASEALHGTLYGCTFHSGAYIPGLEKSNPAELKKHVAETLRLIYYILGAMFHQSIILLSERNARLSEFVKLSKLNTKKAHSLL